MILVDSSVWIDYLRGASTREAARLDAALGVEPVAMGDLILTEVLQGIDDPSSFEEARRLFATLDFIVLGGAEVAVEAARNFRRLRALGVTPRKTVDTIIATRCIVSGLALLHADRDFDPFAAHLGLQVVDTGA